MTARAASRSSCCFTPTCSWPCLTGPCLTGCASCYATLWVLEAVYCIRLPASLPVVDIKLWMVWRLMVLTTLLAFEDACSLSQQFSCYVVFLHVVLCYRSTVLYPAS
jgi:hypothetical protein